MERHSRYRSRSRSPPAYSRYNEADSRHDDAPQGGYAGGYKDRHTSSDHGLGSANTRRSAMGGRESERSDAGSMEIPTYVPETANVTTEAQRHSRRSPDRSSWKDRLNYGTKKDANRRNSTEPSRNNKRNTDVEAPSWAITGSSSSTKQDKKSHDKKDKQVGIETDTARLAQRQKKIDYGYNTVGYERYTKLIPKNKRKRQHPRTPDKYEIISKRGFDGRIKQWRLALHQWDPKPDEEDEDGNAFDDGEIANLIDIDDMGIDLGNSDSEIKPDFDHDVNEDLDAESEVDPTLFDEVDNELEL